MILWSPVRPGIAPVVVVDVGNDNPDYRMSGGAAYARWQKDSGDSLIALLFITFHTLVVRDGVAPQDAHQAFLAIDEYREAMAPDIEGAV